MLMKKYQIFTNLKMNLEGKYGLNIKTKPQNDHYLNLNIFKYATFIKFVKYSNLCIIIKFGLLIDLIYRGAYAIVKRAVNRQTG